MLPHLSPHYQNAVLNVGLTWITLWLSICFFLTFACCCAKMLWVTTSLPLRSRLSLLCLPPLSPKVIEQWLLGQQRKKTVVQLIENELERVVLTFFAVKPRSQFLLSLMYLFYLFGWQVFLSTDHLTWHAEAQKTSCLGVLCPAMLP